MYKPTTYLNIEVDPAHATPDGVAMLERVFNFIDPLTSKPAEELGLTIRLKCRNRPYWIAGDSTQDAVWDEIVGPYLKNKLSIVLNVLQECNNPKYAHYAGGLHLDWLKLQMEPYEIRLRLDHDAEGMDYLPDVFSLLCDVRKAVSCLKDWGATNEHTVIYIPSLTEIETHKALRLDEQTRWEAWQTWQSEQPDSPDEGSTDVTPDENALEKPIFSSGLTYTTAEFVTPNGASRTYDLVKGCWFFRTS
ncbi:hypothetical protein [Adlercreutzia sp. ZJ138]|uniref:hypothetical protein n=1 Tax=Adlercreutzia sp. ZJ138 TaxID=2709405 RepID=UPI0013ED5776|nr:hypothetical protein [Adlercreutzia sp. ZJ138]